MLKLTDSIFTDAEAARKRLEAVRWPDGPVCPFCGAVDAATELKGKSHRPGLQKCRACRKPYSVTVGTVFERSKIPLNKWLLGAYLMAASKKGVSAHQLHRMLGITYKSAWFMAHRLRLAMVDLKPGPMGGEGRTVEVDETYIGRKEGVEKRRGQQHKHAVLTLVERGGIARSFPIDKANVRNVSEVLYRNVWRDSALMTDEAGYYRRPGKGYAKHEFVNHKAKEYARGDVSTNTVEGFFSVFKRGMKGVYQHCGEQHLHRYLAEFDFRYNHRTALGFDDDTRAVAALQGIEGKRLTYRGIGIAE